MAERYDRVQIVSAQEHSQDLLGSLGTVVWCDPGRMITRFGPAWLRVVELDTPVRERIYFSLWDRDLRGVGETSVPERHVGTRNEISFDTLSGVEGALRRVGEFWECFFISAGQTTSPTIESAQWRSGIIGHDVTMPEGDALSHGSAKRLLGELLNVDSWHDVRGPDSLWLK